MPTNAKLHRLTEPLAKGRSKEYFYGLLTGRAYGAYLGVGGNFKDDTINRYGF